MKIKELREKNENELQNLLKESRDKLRQLRFDLVSKQQKNVKEISQLKKDIARILTLFRQKASEGKPQKNNWIWIWKTKKNKKIFPKGV